LPEKGWEAVKRVVVIGGGAAGMMAAISAASAGADTTLLERNNFLGKKLAITGKGRCNLTNASSISETIKNIPGNGNFLYSSLHRFSPDDTMAFFSSLGVKLVTERGKRVFPASGDAHEVVNALKKQLHELGVNIQYDKRVDKLKISDDGSVLGIYCGKDFIEADAVIIATGGKSYPATGSTGDGYRLAAMAGHSITDLTPSLVPLETTETWVSELAGLTLKNVRVTTFSDDKEVESEFGEMLFTHFGVSGPAVLTLSRTICRLLDEGKQVKIKINLKPALAPEQLEARLQRDFDQFSRRHFANSLGQLLPSSLIPVIIALSGIDPEKPSNQITKEERRHFCDLLTGLELTVKCARPIEEAVITAGGVCLKEIDPKTMGSKLVSGLYFAGEVIDVDALTGGYNLQIAFATGRAAGLSAAE